MAVIEETHKPLTVSLSKVRRMLFQFICLKFVKTTVKVLVLETLRTTYDFKIFNHEMIYTAGP